MKQTQISGVCCAPWAGAGCNGIASPECCHGGTGQWQGGGETGHCVPEGRSLARRSCAQQKGVDPGISGSVLCLSQALDNFFL